ncbi:hypothetical protein DFH07DRAFT_993463 [Mycena maculata]|uniref:Uncharacterized protein n=1 Tax=Mycena maculata TaxID=230809 RepID=A0AAD7JVP9_9AGAR|nr:hypothetical protein DFH07DRAFT_993463 [Mycena maculata]
MAEVYASHPSTIQCQYGGRGIWDGSAKVTALFERAIRIGGNRTNLVDPEKFFRFIWFKLKLNQIVQTLQSFDKIQSSIDALRQHLVASTPVRLHMVIDTPASLHKCLNAARAVVVVNERIRDHTRSRCNYKPSERHARMDRQCIQWGSSSSESCPGQFDRDDVNIRTSMSFDEKWSNKHRAREDGNTKHYFNSEGRLDGSLMQSPRGGVQTAKAKTRCEGLEDIACESARASQRSKDERGKETHRRAAPYLRIAGRLLEERVSKCVKGEKKRCTLGDRHIALWRIAIDQKV